MTNQEAYDTTKKILDALTEDNRKVVLGALLVGRCRKCLDHDPNERFWCCYESRGG